ALALAGIDLVSEKTALGSDFPDNRKSEVAADCYTLLLVLAGIRTQQPMNGGLSKERFEESLRILDRAHRLGFDTPAYYLRRARVLEQLGEFDLSRQHEEQAAALPLEGELDYFLLGEEKFRGGSWQQAADSFSRAVDLQPSHFWAQFFLAVCRLKMREWEAAKTGLNACLAQQPDFVWAYLFRSFANEKLQAVAEAEADFQKALELKPGGDA